MNVNEDKFKLLEHENQIDHNLIILKSLQDLESKLKWLLWHFVLALWVSCVIMYFIIIINSDIDVVAFFLFHFSNYIYVQFLFSYILIFFNLVFFFHECGLEATEQFEDAFSGLKVISFEENCIRLSLRTYIPKSKFLSQQIIEDTTSVNHELLIGLTERTMGLRNVEIFPNDVYIRDILDAAKPLRFVSFPCLKISVSFFFSFFPFSSVFVIAVLSPNHVFCCCNC